MNLKMVKLNISQMILIVLMLAISSLFGESFIDHHNDASISGWTINGQRGWSENSSYMTPAYESNYNGFIINNNTCGSNGVLSVNITADIWNGQKGGIVFRWTSINSFYFVAVQPGNQYSNYIRFCKNSTDAGSGITIAQNFPMGTTFNLKVEMNGSDFNFYIDDDYKGSVTDSDHATGQIGYGYSNQWNDYINFNSIVWNETSLNEKFLIIAAASLYANTDIQSAIGEYKTRIAAEGWDGTVITVSKTTDDNPMHQCANEAELKDVIKGYYQNGYEGFVFIGSSDEIPLVKWRVTERDKEYDPTDLYYADIGTWFDIGSDGIYESFYAKSAPEPDGNYKPDYSRPASPSNPYYQAEMIYGRIDAGPLSENKNDEITLVLSYLNKINTYRENGSQLTPDEQNRAFAIIDDDWSSKGQGYMLAKAIPNIHLITDVEMTNVVSLITHLEKGYKFVMQAAHSDQKSTGFDEWKNGNKSPRDSSFTLETLDTIDARVNYINLFSCSACDFEFPNFGASYIFKEHHTYNVTGSTGGWGPFLDTTYWKVIKENTPVGKAFKDMFSRLNDPKPIEQKDLSLPKAIICGDPLLTYGYNLSNEAPKVTNVLQAKEMQHSVIQSINFQYADPENDNITLSMDETIFPNNAYFDGTSLSWDPEPDLIGKEIPFTLIATDSNNNNSYSEYFSIYVSHFSNSQFESMDGWQTQGSPTFGMAPLTTPFRTPETRYIQTANSWGGVSQSIPVKSDQYYAFEIGVANMLTINPDSACVVIPQRGIRFPLLSITQDNELKYIKVYFNSKENTELTFSIISGSGTCATSGKLFVAGTRLIECSQVVMGDVDFDGTVSAVDVLMTEHYLNDDTYFTESQRELADVTLDNYVSVHDRRIIMYSSVGLLPELPIEMTIGDVNDDKDIDILDAMAVGNHVNGGTQLDLAHQIAADVNGNEEADTEDHELISQYSVGSINEFPYKKK